MAFKINYLDIKRVFMDNQGAKVLCAQYAEYRYKRLHGIEKSLPSLIEKMMWIKKLFGNPKPEKRIVHTYRDSNNRIRYIYSDDVPNAPATKRSHVPASMESLEDTIPPDFELIDGLIKDWAENKPIHYKVYCIEYMEVNPRFVGSGRRKEQKLLANKAGISDRSYRRYKKHIHDEIVRVHNDVDQLEDNLYEPDEIDLQLVEEFKKIA